MSNKGMTNNNRHSFEDIMDLKEDLLKMLLLGSHNDVKIKLRDGEIAANKDILMARSDYFATTFSNNKFIEGETNSVDISHCSKAVMEKITKFLFSGAVMFSDLDFPQLLELSHISEMILLTKLKVKVDEYLTLDMICGRGKDVQLLPELILGLKLAHGYNLSAIGSSIVVELYLNLKDIPNDIASSASFKTLPLKMIREIFLYKASTLFQLPTTKQKFVAFMVWLSKNEANEEQKNEIVESFNFEDFTVEELMTSVRDSDLYSGTKIDKRVLELFKNQDNLLKETKDLTETKDLKIKELNSKIRGVKDTLEDAKNYINSYHLLRFKSNLDPFLN